MTRYWVSWWSATPMNMETPFRWWDTGERFTRKGDTSYVAYIDADSEEQVWQQVGGYFPDNERRFISKQADDWEPPKDRFP